MPAGPAIVVHSLAHAVAALEAAAEAGRPVLLLSAADAGLSAGAGWWREVIAAAHEAVPAAQAAIKSAALIDCGDDAGAAQAALRSGIEAIVFSGPDETLERLADIARQRGCRVLRERPFQALDLGDDFFAPPETLRRRVLAVLCSDTAANHGPGEISRGNNVGTG
jgi:hypothetical protein